MCKVKLYIFDLDGTLVDSFLDIAKSTNRVLEKLGLTQLPEKQIIGYIGQGALWLVQQSLKAAGDPTASKMPEARELFMADYKEHLTDTTYIFPGVEKTLKELEKTGAILTVCTNKPSVFADQLLKNLNLYDCFQAVLGSDCVPEKKPSPLPLIQLMEQFKVPPSQTLMVGDSTFDIVAGRRAKTWTCGVSFGNQPVSLLLEEGADFVVSDFADIPSRVDAIIP